MTMVCWEVLLSKGQEWDWFGDPFYRIQTLAILFSGGGFIGLIYRETHIASPLINFKTLRDRNFRACCIIIFCAFGVLYANTTSLPGLLQSLFGYDATTSGLVLFPRAGVGAVIVLLIVGRSLQGRGVDARWPMAAGLIVLAVGNYWMSQLNLFISPLAGGMAAGGDHCGAFDDLRSWLNVASVFVHPSGNSAGRRSGCWAAVAQRRRKRWHIRRPDDRRTPRAVPRPAAQRIPRWIESGGAKLLRSDQKLFSISTMVMAHCLD